MSFPKTGQLCNLFNVWIVIHNSTCFRGGTLKILREVLFFAMVFFVASFFDAQNGRVYGREVRFATKNAITHTHVGQASWYGPGFLGRHTASGKIYRRDAIFVAHRSYPFGTTLRIINLQNHKVIVANVEDRGPYVPGRSLDLSQRAAKELAMTKGGVAPISYEVVGPE